MILREGKEEEEKGRRREGREGRGRRREGREEKVLVGKGRK